MTLGNWARTWRVVRSAIEAQQGQHVRGRFTRVKRVHVQLLDTASALRRVQLTQWRRSRCAQTCRGGLGRQRAHDTPDLGLNLVELLVNHDTNRQREHSGL
jgi:hypothetical protein